ncbi:MAG: ribose 5-phosphate isomerase B [Desulfobacterota bacterium]|nr:ribose 5-phosphate isomerase B [Thermodesulfobacteriota bacterium]
MQIGLACDHGGYELKEALKSFLRELNHEPLDFGTFSGEAVDYPDYGIRAAEKVSRGELERAILICGTGIGMSIVANKFRGVRAALVQDLFSARLSREHTDANILVIGGRIVARELAKEIVKVWLETPFSGGRHKRRLEQIERLEEKNFRPPISAEGDLPGDPSGVTQDKTG